MAGVSRVVTANLPADLVSRLDELAARLDRSKSWIIKQALAEWIAEEDRRHEMTLEAIRDMDQGRFYTHEEVMAHVELRKRERRENRDK